MKKIPIIYARVSTNNGTQDFNRQIEDLKKVITGHGYKIDDILIYSEKISGYKKSNERPQLSELLELVKSNPTKYVVYTTEISRIGRNPTETRKIIDELTELKVPVYIQSLNQYTIDNDGKRNMIMNIILQVLIEYANLESETMKERSKSGKLNSVKKGKAGGSLNFPYGYKKDDDGYLVIDENERPIIEEIFNLYRDGNGCKVIARILNERNIPTRYQKIHGEKKINYKNMSKSGNDTNWSDVTILHIIQNSIYIGKRKYKNEIVKSPSIIDESLFNQCQKIRLNKTHRNYLTTYTYLLKDLCVCGNCGRNYFAKYKPVPNGDKVYVCSSKLIPGKWCGNTSINIQLIESVMYDILIESELVTKYISNKNDIKKNLEVEIKTLSELCSSTDKELKTKQKESERLLDLYLSENVTKSKYVERSDKIDNEIENLQSKLDNIKSKLNEKKNIFSKFDSKKTTKEYLTKSRQSREELKMIFNQIFHQFIVNKIDNDHVLVTVYITVDGIVLDTPIYVVIDVSGIRKRPIIFRYYGISILKSKPKFDNNILVNDINKIWNEIQSKNIDWINPKFRIDYP